MGMNIQWSTEFYIYITALLISLIGSYFIIRINWKRYGLLFLLSGLAGNIICYIFVKAGFYSFPYRLFDGISVMPFDALLIVFPFLVLLGVCYSPKKWAYKIPFYWVIVHLGMLSETLMKINTKLIEYDFEWDFWDSYTWWWIFFLGFEWIGGLIVPEKFRNPIDSEAFRYGKWAWVVLHFILILTIFLGGYYLGRIIDGNI